MRVKKLSMVFLGLAAITLVTGCGSNDSEKTLVCKNSEDMDGMTIGQTISMTFKGDELNRMKMDVSTKLTDDDAKENWDAFTELMDGQNEETKKDGITMKVTKDAKKYEYVVTVDVDIKKASKEDLDAYNLSDLTSDNGTLEDNKKEAEGNGFTCEVK